jgi:FKBP-type peptidyl-prolyl cis-trans isomerase FklB
MRKYAILFILIISFSINAQENLSTDQQKFSYAIGVQIGQQIGQNISAQPTELDTNALLMGITDVINQSGLKLTVQEMQAAVQTVQAEEQKRQEAQGVRNKIEGENFLTENKKKGDVTELASGLQYKVLIDGNGAQPKGSDTVVVHYRGTLINGTEFDSSYGRGQPVAIALNNVIQGWQEAVPLMKVGSKWQIYVPSGLAYGEQAAGPVIGPNATLIFDIELLSINK